MLQGLELKMIKKVKVGGRDAAYLFEVFVDRPEEMV